jgi:hypothetical protein
VGELALVALGTHVEELGWDRRVGDKVPVEEPEALEWVKNIMHSGGALTRLS